MKAILLIAFIFFRHPDGTPVAINPDTVSSVHPAAKGYHIGTMIDSTGNGTVIVAEPYEEVIKRLSEVKCK